MASTTPLLLLLDSILSQDAGRIQEVRKRIHRMIVEAGLEVPANQNDNDFTSDVQFKILAKDVDLLLTGYPQLAGVPSAHDGSLPLHFAASLGSVEVAGIIMNKFPQAATTPNTKGKIPLHYAAREGKTDMVSFFLRTNPETAQVASKKQKLALHFAAGDGHIEVVRRLLNVFPMGASLVSAKGKLPLHFAARWGHLQIASDLLYVYPAGIYAVDWEGSLPLHEAAREGQFQMSKLLVDRYPAALATANMRGETPLFAAVRSDNVDLVILYLQGWPHGGSILKTVTADDNVEGWDPDILELCLRSAVGIFTGCELMEGKHPPGFFGMRQENHAFYSGMQSSGEVGFHANPGAGLCHGTSEPASAVGAALTANNRKRILSDADQRSKSPILEIDNKRKKRPKPEDRRRSMCGSERFSDDLEAQSNGENTCKPARRRTFIPLHAALECGASSAVLRCVLKRGPDNQLTKRDDCGRLPLHLAVANCREDDEIQLLLDDILKPHPEASMVRDVHKQLPLHIALTTTADFRIIRALIEANPSSGVDLCQTDVRRFRDAKPVIMATEYGCDLSTLYLLLRLEPSVIHDWESHVSSFKAGQLHLPEFGRRLL